MSGFMLIFEVLPHRSIRDTAILSLHQDTKPIITQMFRMRSQRSSDTQCFNKRVSPHISDQFLIFVCNRLSEKKSFTASPLTRYVDSVHSEKQRRCADWSASLLVAHGIMADFLWWESNTNTFIYWRSEPRHSSHD